MGIIHNYKKNKGNFFKKNVFLLITVFLVIILIAGILILRSFISENDRKTLENADRESEHIYIVNEKMIDEIITQMRKLMQLGNLKVLFNPSVSERLYYDSCDETVDYIKNITDINMNLDSVYLYSKYRDEIVTDTGTVEYNIFKDKSWETEYLNSEKDEFKVFFRNGEANKKLFTFLYHTNSGESIDGCIVINVDMQKQLSVSSKNGFSVIGKASANELICTERGKNRELADGILSTGNSGIIRYKNAYYAVSKKASKHADFFYCYIEPLNDYARNIVWIFIKISAILILLLTIFVFLSFWIADLTYKPIKEMSIIMENPDSQEAKEYLQNDENTRKIADKIFSVVYKNEILCRELNEKMEIFNYAQLKALQWQINPHFIFNTLNILYLVTDKIAGKGNKASAGLLSLSKLMRYSLKTEPMVVALYEELEAVNEYVNLMSTRLGDSFDFEIICDENIKSKPVIKMCIQPILENAFRYGIKNLDRRGSIKIEVFEEEKCLKIVISDNGCGIKEEKLAEIIESINKKPEISEAHIGLINANSRLILMYGKEYRVKVESKENIGTKVTIRCPEKIQKSIKVY